MNLATPGLSNIWFPLPFDRLRHRKIFFTIILNNALRRSSRIGQALSLNTST
jgi:hypothetical protein